MDTNEKRYQQFNQNIIAEMWNIDNYIQDSLGQKRNFPSMKERFEHAEIKKKNLDAQINNKDGKEKSS